MALKTPADQIARLNQSLKNRHLPAKKLAASEDNTAVDQGNDAVLPTEIVSNPEDFVEVEYRALSAAMLWDRPIDFSDPKMLKRGVKLLAGQTVYKDHEVSVDNWVGTVSGTSWADAVGDFPAGINATLKLDTVKDPMTVRGVLQGALHSASVTVQFEWKPSHPQLMESGDFYRSLGTEVDGQMVRIVVTAIVKFLEISLVYQGADQYAKQLDDAGEPLKAAANLAAQSTTHNLAAGGTPGKDNMNLLEALKKVLGKDVTEANAEEALKSYSETFAAAVKALEDSRAKVEALTKELNEKTESYNTKLAQLEKSIADNAEAVAVGAKYLKDERDEAVRLCKLAKGTEVSAAILGVIETGKLETVQAFKGEFQKEVDAKFPAHCAKCNSTEITRQSAKDLEGLQAAQAESAAKPSLSVPALNTIKNLHS